MRDLCACLVFYYDYRVQYCPDSSAIESTRISVSPVRVEKIKPLSPTGPWTKLAVVKFVGNSRPHEFTGLKVHQEFGIDKPKGLVMWSLG